jgi:hypothetical protein
MRSIEMILSEGQAHRNKPIKTDVIGKIIYKTLRKFKKKSTGEGAEVYSRHDPVKDKTQYAVVITAYYGTDIHTTFKNENDAIKLFKLLKKGIC